MHAVSTKLISTAPILLRSPERKAVHVLRCTLHQHHLVRALGVRGVYRAVRASRLADAEMGVVERPRTDRASGKEGDDHERKPSPDRELAMLGAPAAHSSSDIAASLGASCPIDISRTAGGLGVSRHRTYPKDFRY